MPNLLIIIASTRPGRAGLTVARWFEPIARAHGAFDGAVADLAQWNLPFLDQPNHPKLRQYTKQHTIREILEQPADAMLTELARVAEPMRSLREATQPAA